MYRQHAEIELPPNDTSIWRYMSFAKFVCMLQTRRLYFATLKQLQHDDKWEAAYPIKKAKRAAAQAWRIQGHSASQIHDMKGRFERRKTDTIARFGVSCWHMGAFESAAMWKIYGDSSQAVAIQSTVGRLVESFTHLDRDLWIGNVTYFRPPTIPPIHDIKLSLFHKLDCFAHERELRAVVELSEHDMHWVNREEWNGLDVPLHKLIARVCVSPRAPKWFLTTAHMELAKYDLSDITVAGSYLDVDPDF